MSFVSVVHVVFCIAYSVVNYFNVTFSDWMHVTSVWEGDLADIDYKYL